MSWKMSCQTCNRQTVRRSYWAGCASLLGHTARSTSSTSPPAGQMDLPLMPCSTNISEIWPYLDVGLTDLYLLSVSPLLFLPKASSPLPPISSLHIKKRNIMQENTHWVFISIGLKCHTAMSLVSST